ncbi:MAG: sigma-70 family RNA polymerase sigma factor [Gemmatimonadaceae bacterium]
MNPPRSTPPYPNTSIVDISSRGEKMSPDAEVIRRMAAGDEQALVAFYDRWNSLVHAVVLRILRQSDDVEDVVEEVFWQAWRQSNRYLATRGSVQTWLLTIARSRALDRVRSVKRLREDPLEDENGAAIVQQASEGDASMDAESAERRVIVIAALAELPAEQREALELGYYSGLSQSEIAERTGQPLGTIKTRMRLAMQKLKGRLQILREDAR